MAEVLANQRRQFLADQREPERSEQGQAEGDAVEQDLAAGEDARSQARVLQRQQKADKQKSAASQVEGQVEQAVQEQAKAVAKQSVLRWVNVALGSTILLFVVTVLIWTFQFIVGNVLESKIVPPLKLWEIILWLASLLLLMGVTLLIVAMISFMVKITHFDWDAIKILGESLWSAFKDAFHL
ncbi:MAG: hypothetical protein WC465_02725 [Patescibacteria group bacterium]